MSLAMPMAHAQAGAAPLAIESSSLLHGLQAGGQMQWPKVSCAAQVPGAAMEVLVLTYRNPTLDRSLQAKAATHPGDAAAVKALPDDAGRLSGWAVSVKTSTQRIPQWQGLVLARNSGHRASNVSAVAQANGLPLSAGCHAQGRDLVFIPHHPLDWSSATALCHERWAIEGVFDASRR